MFTVNWDSQVALVVKNLLASAEDIDVGSSTGSGICPGGAHGNPLQYSYLENPMDRETWWATVHWVTKNQTQLSDLACMHAIIVNRVQCLAQFFCISIM